MHERGREGERERERGRGIEVLLTIKKGLKVGKHNALSGEREVGGERDGAVERERERDD